MRKRVVMIAVYEPQCKGLAHESHNAGFLLALHRAFPDKRIIFFAEKTHIAAVKYCFFASGNDFSAVTCVATPLARARDTWRDYRDDYGCIDRVLSYVHEMGISHVFFLSINTGSLVALKRLKYKKYTEFTFTILLHGIIEYANCSIWEMLKSEFRLLWLHAFRFALTYKSNVGFAYVPMSTFCYDNIKNTLLFNTIPLKPLFLPIIFQESFPAFKNKNITFATIGKGDAAKVCELDRLLLGSGLSEYTIKVLGSFPEGLIYSEHIQLTSHQDRRLSRTEISEHMQNVDVLLFFYDENSYTYSQSGAFTEIFQYDTPAIFLKNKNFAFHNAPHLPFAQEVQSMEEMAAEVGALIRHSPEHIKKYNNFQGNIQRRRRELDPAFNPDVMRNLFEVDSISLHKSIK